MQNLETIMELTNTLQDQYSNYTQKPTKAESARIRKTLMQIKKLVTPARTELLDADKG